MVMGYKRVFELIKLVENKYQSLSFFFPQASKKNTSLWDGLGWALGLMKSLDR